MTNTNTTQRKAVALTTFDNPHNPIDEFEKWFSFEVEKGYDSSGELAREAKVSDLLSDEENRQEVERAIDKIVKEDPLCIYRKIEEGEKPDPKMIAIYNETMKQMETA